VKEYIIKMSKINIENLAKDIFYMEDAFPNSEIFINKIEYLHNNKITNNVIAGWSRWVDGYPVLVDSGEGTHWEQKFPDRDDQHRGDFMLLDWDITVNDQNQYWPRKLVDNNFDSAHKESYEIIQLIEKDYQKALKIWCKKTKYKFPKYVTKNYCLRKYRVGGAMGSHIDRNIDNPINTMDWTALVYLNDNYEGGELVFDDLDLAIKPKQGSILFFPCLTYHSVRKITKGNKYYLFFFIHTDSGISTSLGEPYNKMEEEILAFEKRIDY
jgi:hypothetical protein